MALPAPGQPTTHILKPPISRFSATNRKRGVRDAPRRRESVSMSRRLNHVSCGIERTLLVQRYDRTPLAEDGSVRRVHQEDFCQALGVPPENQIRQRRRPWFEGLFRSLVRRVAVPARGRCAETARCRDLPTSSPATLTRTAKNFSILYDGDGPRLAPLYDLLATVAYPQLSPKFAMAIGKRATLAETGRKGLDCNRRRHRPRPAVDPPAGFRDQPKRNRTGKRGFSRAEASRVR